MNPKQQKPTVSSPVVGPPAANAPRIYEPPPPDVKGPRLEEFLKNDPADPALLAEIPTSIMLHDVPTWDRLIVELRAYHAEKYPGQPLLKAQTRDRALFRFWVG